MPLLGLLDHPLGKVDADPTSGFECREQIAKAAADLKHAPSWRHQEAKVAFQQPVIEPFQFSGTEWDTCVVEGPALLCDVLGQFQPRSLTHIDVRIRSAEGRRSVRQVDAEQSGAWTRQRP